MNVIMKTIFGSHLYGTNTPVSDRDYKGIFLPTREQILLGRIPKSIKTDTNNSNEKNSSEDIDCEMYSLHYFIELACKGETVALDMLHAPIDNLEVCSPIWLELIQYRERFYTKNLKAFVDYARRQASKYGIKGSRLNKAKEFLDALSKYSHTGDIRLADIWNKLPIGDHVHIIEKDNRVRQYEICGKRIQETARIDYAYDIMNTFYNNYGHRAVLASKNEGIDWKAVSHAVRAGMQLKQLYTEKTITFPLKDADLLTQIKRGRLDYTTQVAPLLEKLIEECEVLANESNLPEKVERVFWDTFIMQVIGREWQINV